MMFMRFLFFSILRLFKNSEEFRSKASSSSKLEPSSCNFPCNFFNLGELATLFILSYSPINPSTPYKLFVMVSILSVLISSWFSVWSKLSFYWLGLISDMCVRSLYSWFLYRVLKFRVFWCNGCIWLSGVEKCCLSCLSWSLLAMSWPVSVKSSSSPGGFLGLSLWFWLEWVVGLV